MSPKVVAGEGSNAKRSSVTMSDTSSISAVGSSNSRQFSDQVKEAWRTMKGHRHSDPLEQWMADHSGGTLKDAPATKPAWKESSEEKKK
ncbi:hypothetical protein F5Y19DRAFT_417184 [Xylariaceae sp. FL1651]|nr:hypothetical protein F5Y19DRAFT_417184 [Xylariaceae sp. FL1651]